LLEVEEETELD
jgi:hypothetical protein